MELPDLRDLELIEAVHRHGTLTAAAEQMYVSQPALSQRLQRLEQRLGTLVFERRGRQLVATPAGQPMIQAARIALHEVRDAIDEIGGRHQEEPTVIRLWTQCSTNYQWLPQVMAAWRAAHPGAEVAVVNETDCGSGYVEALEHG